MPAKPPQTTNVETQVAVILTKLEYIAIDLTELKNNVEGKYVTKEEFEPVKRLVFGLVMITLGAVVTAALTLVLRSK